MKRLYRIVYDGYTYDHFDDCLFPNRDKGIFCTEAEALRALPGYRDKSNVRIEVYEKIKEIRSKKGRSNK